jgi:hypothetical protein
MIISRRCSHITSKMGSIDDPRQDKSLSHSIKSTTNLRTNQKEDARVKLTAMPPTILDRAQRTQLTREEIIAVWIVLKTNLRTAKIENNTLLTSSDPSALYQSQIRSVITHIRLPRDQ